MAANKKKLRQVTNKDRLKGLPKSREEAIKRGITRYLRGDEEWVIRNYGSKTAPKGRDTRAALRKASRGGMQRRAEIANKSISEKEYKAIAKKHGFSEDEAVKKYEINEAKLKKLRGKTKTLKGTPLDYEHYLPNASSIWWYRTLEKYRSNG